MATLFTHLWFFCSQHLILANFHWICRHYHIDVLWFLMILFRHTKNYIIGGYQRLAINRFFITHNLIHSYSLKRWFICTGCNEYAQNVNIKLILSVICLIRIIHQTFVLIIVAFTKKKKKGQSSKQSKHTTF